MSKNRSGPTKGQPNKEPEPRPWYQLSLDLQEYITHFLREVAWYGLQFTFTILFKYAIEYMKTQDIDELLLQALEYVHGAFVIIVVCQFSLEIVRENAARARHRRSQHGR